jgi:hypothetical protein
MTDNDIVTRLRDCTCVPHGEICREAADEIERIRNNPFTWWAREKRFNCTIEASVAVTFEFLEEADAIGNDEILRHISDMVAFDIMGAYRNRKNRINGSEDIHGLFGTPHRLPNKENTNDTN